MVMPLPESADIMRYNVRSHRRAPGAPCKARSSRARPSALRCYSAWAQKWQLARALRGPRQATALAKHGGSGAGPGQTKRRAWTLNAAFACRLATCLYCMRGLDLGRALTLESHGPTPRTTAMGSGQAMVYGAGRRR
jgi:hypothetical protein